MKELILKTFFGGFYKDYLFYKIEYQILTSCVNEKQILEILPQEVDGGYLDVDKAAYVRDNKIIFGDGKIMRRSKVQNLTALYYSLVEQGKIDSTQPYNY